MSNIKVNQNVELKPLVLKTKARCLHYHDPNTKLQDSIIIEQQWDPRAYTVEKIDNYLAINFWRYSDGYYSDPYRVSSFNSRTNTHMVPIGNKYPGSRIQLRIYQNRKVALIHEHRINVDGHDQIKTFVQNDMDGGDLVYRSWGARHEPGVDATLFFNSIKDMTDKEIEAAAKTLRKAEVTQLINYVGGRLASDISDSNEIIAFNQTDRGYVHLGANTMDRVKKFFGDSIPKNYGKITNLESLMRFSYYKDANTDASIKKNEDMFKTLMEPYKEQIRRLQPRTQFWFRTDSYIGCYIKGSQDNYYWDRTRNGSAWVFLYNYKTRSRILMKYNIETGSYTKNVPSLNALDGFHFGPTWDWRGNYGQQLPQMDKPAYSVVIANNLPIKELFANTNIGFLLENNPDFKLRNLHVYTRNGTNPQIPISQIITKESIQEWALILLGSSNNPVLEMLLKSKMYNLYDLALKDMTNQGGRFDDIDAKKARHSWYGRTQYFPYHGKQKNLSKMFEMTVDQLRVLDELYATVNRDDYYWNSNHYRPHWLDSVLHVPLSSLDLDTFKKLCEMSKDNDYGSLPEMNLNGLKPKEIVNTFYIYKDHMQEFKDYLNARKTLQTIQERFPDRSIFSERDYPLKPKAGKKFVRFISGMTGQGRYGSQRLNTWYDFQNYYSSNYQNCCEFVPNVGVSLTLGTIEMLKYLHNDASFWASFYQDSTKTESFQKALERVKDYVYVDEDMGLEMVSPSSIQDLKAEGETLHHCVGSYVDSIIGGKENIMFLRRSDMPGAPFYTVELAPPMDDHGKILDEHKKIIRQVHCYYNGDLTEEGQDKAYEQSSMPVYNKKFNIVEFLLKWAKAKKDIDSQSIRSRYGALCALR